MPTLSEPCPNCGGTLRVLELVDKRDRGSGRPPPEVECNRCHKQYRQAGHRLEFVRDRPKPGK